jgi:hypothetical protein
MDKSRNPVVLNVQLVFIVAVKPSGLRWASGMRGGELELASVPVKDGKSLD